MFWAALEDCGATVVCDQSLQPRQLQQRAALVCLGNTVIGRQRRWHFRAGAFGVVADSGSVDEGGGGNGVTAERGSVMGRMEK